ncbi:MFS transporter [Neptunomonas qingdaonensis]|uniref:Predicted arabinose efflux permease, MFS family n=1 Tax=Neptunomonas qingdaonensis TaxID=1045558 RepID=A0A1I2STQ0_9GAMM|nr:MFS transporter [Neptunomonas qingdaonensis]SFG54297.1 Predicted arabinose efflux permease, MFS family [Neptunomonas qingdaonensis]
MNRSVVLLSLCQALLGTGNVLLISVNGLIGQSLSPSDALITLPIAMQFIGLMLATIPASLIMQRIGRRNGFYLGNSLGIIGAVISAVALLYQNFFVFCVGTTLLGVGIGFGTLYRFAAVEACEPEQKNRAISMVMLGGVLAAILGPALAVESRDWISSQEFVGSFVGLMGLYSLALLLLSGVSIPQPANVESEKGPSRPLFEIVMQPVFIVAVVAAMASYTVMNLLMTATPLAMARCGFSFPQMAWVIEWHLLGMFLPSFFTGRLIQRFGAVCMMMLGGLIMLLCILVNLNGQSEWHFWSALFLLGLGWNFMFISATSMVTGAYTHQERAKTQATNEFLVFGMVTLSALSSGWLEVSMGWETMNVLMIPVVVWAMLVIAVFSKKMQQAIK